MVKKKWIVDGRFRIPFWGKWLWKYIPQPTWLRKWYYKKSFQWWEHPSNHHWKGWLFGGAEGQTGPGPNLNPGERDIWSGEYCSGNNENERN